MKSQGVQVWLGCNKYYALLCISKKIYLKTTKHMTTKRIQKKHKHIDAALIGNSEKQQQHIDQILFIILYACNNIFVESIGNARSFSDSVANSSSSMAAVGALAETDTIA